MNPSRQQCFLTLLLIVLGIPACATREGVQITDRLFPGAVAGDRGPFLTRLVDDFTGEAIAGAEVFLVGESMHPIAGEFWFTHRGSSDADGFVRIARPNGDRDWNLQVVRHPRYGTVARTGHANDTWRLGAAYDVPVRITDWLGRPARGARIGLCGGCGHTPDLVNAVADADGVAVLRGIDPQQGIADLYVQHPLLHFFYEPIEWLPGSAPMPVQCAFGPAKSGRVVDHRGAPVAGAHVRVGGRHRGPWARTAADGSFTVLGAEPDEAPHQVATPTGRDVYFPSASRYPVTLQLPDLADPDATHGTIDVPSTSEVDDVAPATRTLKVRVENPPSPRLSFAVDSPGLGAGDDDSGDTITVPRAGPFVLEVHDESDGIWNPRQFAFDDASAVSDPLLVAWTPDARVIGRVVDGRGRPVAATVRWVRSAFAVLRRSNAHDESALVQHRCDDGRFDLRRRAGWSLLEVAPATPGLRPRLLWVNVPAARAGAALDLGEVTLGAAPQLRVVDAAGTPLPDASVRWARPGWHPAGEPEAWPLDPEGGWRGPDLQAGDVLFARRDEDHVEHRVRLAGDGPFTIELPAAQLDLEVVDAAGAPLAGAVAFLDRSQRVEGGSVALRGLPAGRLRLYVGVQGHRSAIVDVVAATEPQSVRVVVPTR